MIVTHLVVEGSCPDSVFREGKFAGGRRAQGTFPKLCMPCLRDNCDFAEEGSEFSP